MDWSRFPRTEEIKAFVKAAVDILQPFHNKVITESLIQEIAKFSELSKLNDYTSHTEDFPTLFAYNLRFFALQPLNKQLIRKITLLAFNQALENDWFTPCIQKAQCQPQPAILYIREIEKTSNGPSIYYLVLSGEHAGDEITRLHSWRFMDVLARRFLGINKKYWHGILSYYKLQGFVLPAYIIRKNNVCYLKEYISADPILKKIKRKNRGKLEEFKMQETSECFNTDQ
ncbi:MAG: hypothetical protein ACPL1K_02290 [Candidatus Kryptoniota bacterium]